MCSYEEGNSSEAALALRLVFALVATVLSRRARLTQQWLEDSWWPSRDPRQRTMRTGSGGGHGALLYLESSSCSSWRTADASNSS
jgi:hypothetical protein